MKGNSEKIWHSTLPCDITLCTLLIEYLCNLYNYRPLRSTTALLDCISWSLTFATYAYVTYRDIRDVKHFKNRTVIAIKAPPETRLEVPDPKEVSLFIYLFIYLLSIKYLEGPGVQGIKKKMIDTCLWYFYDLSLGLIFKPVVPLSA